MEKINQGHPMSQSPDFVKENIELLKSLFPTIVKEGKIVMEELEALLGEDVEKEDEYYNFTWAGKSMARREANKPSTATLRPDKSESKEWDKTNNIYIEGDNLEVLKLLQKSYSNKVKLIYIDPPYNTGKDFVYNDNYKDNLKNYRKITGQLDDDGDKVSTNTESGGRFHSNWLNMIYPRLYLARNLLKEDGVIFISINNDEVYNLTKICFEIFGEENYISTIANVNNPKGRSDDKYIATSHEYILVFKKKEITFYGWKPEEHITKRYNKSDANGIYREIDLRKTGDNDRREDRPNLFYYFYFNEKTNDFFPSKEKLELNDYIEIIPTREDNSHGNWRWEINSALNQIDLLIPKFMNVRNKWGVFVKDYLTAEKRVKPTSSWTQKFANSERGTEQFIELGFKKQFFNNPKPVGLLEAIFETTVREGDLVLDFFGGSSTTAHAIFKFNLFNEQNIKFILIQLPELTDKTSDAFLAGFKTIAEIGKERIRRAGKKIKDENPLLSEKLDTGFKVFKLDSSNIKSWDSNPNNLEETLFTAGKNIKEDRSEEDVLFEILLKYGLDLTVPIEEKSVNGKMVYSVGYGTLFICLSDNITTEIAEAIGQWKEELEPPTSRVIFKDSGFNDVQKTNSIQILKRFGINEVNTI